MNNKILIIFFIILLIPLINAEVQNLGTVKNGDCISLLQSYYNSTWCNITKINYPNKTAFNVNIAMDRDLNGNYNYTFCDTFINGEYQVTTTLDIDGEVTTVPPYSFDVTPNGFQINVATAILQVILFLAVFGVFLLLLYASLKIPFGNLASPEGKIISVNNFKYLKIGAIALSYVVLMFLFAILDSIMVNFIFSGSSNKIFEWLYNIMLAFMIPVAIASIVIGFAVFINDIYVKKKLQRRYWR